MPKAKMSKTNVENGLNRIKAEKIFTDREAPREAFWKLYQEISNDMESYKVLTYYGIGGIGKTTLIGKLIQEINNKKGKFVSLNFERYESLSKILILRDLGTKLFRLDKNKFKFYRFRFAMKRYAEETGQSLEIKNDNSSFLSNNPLMELGMDLSENVPDIIEKLPIISTISKAITILDKSREVIKNKIDTRNMKKSLLEIQVLEVAQLVNNLEKYFYEDLAEAMLNLKEPLVIFLDTYEKFADSFSNSEYKSSEEWLKNIVSKPQGILWVIAGRERIKWEEEFEAEQHLLENLSLKDASDFLVTAGVDETLTPKIYELTSGNPVFLDVCIDRYIELINEGKVPTIDDFGESQTKLVERYARYMDTDIKEMAYLLAYLGKWTTEDILKIKERTNIIKLSITDYNEFIRHSFVIKDDKTFYMTKIVQKVFYDSIPAILKEAFHKLNFSFIEEKNEEEKDKIDSCESLTMLVNELLKSNPEPKEETTKKVEEILIKINDLYNKGLIEEEFVLSSRIYKYFINKGDKYNKIKLIVMDYFAKVYDDIGNYTKALELHKEAYEKMKIELGENDPNTLTSLNNLAACYGSTGNYEKALKLLKKAYEKQKEILGENNPNTLILLNNLASFYSKIGDKTKALELSKETYEKQKEILGENHPDTLTSLNNLASFYFDIGDNVKALELNEEVYKKLKKILGKNHPNTLFSLSNLAYSYIYIGDNEKALEINKEVYERQKEVLGENHPDTLTLLNNLAFCYNNIGNNEKALKLNTEAYEKLIKILGENHPSTLNSLNNLATSYLYIGDYAKALELFERVYEKRKKILGENHPDTLSSLSNLAYVYSEIGKEEKALELLEEVYRKRKRIFGEKNQNTLRIKKYIDSLINKLK